MLEVLAALAPSLSVGLLFWWVIRSILRGDRHEREALAKIDAQEAQRPVADQHPAAEAEVDPEPKTPDAGVSGPGLLPCGNEQDRHAPGPSTGGTRGDR